jgi:sigma-54 dependent transcriptional regulator, flagellar regulatory protein
MSAVMVDTRNGSMSNLQRAVVYDSDAERATQVAAVLRFLDLEALVVDHAALVRSVMTSCAGRQALLIGDVHDVPDWRELGAVLKGQFCDAAVVSYGSQAVADKLVAAAGANRVLRLPFPFKYSALATALQPFFPTEIQGGTAVRLPTGSSPAIRTVIDLIRQVAGHDSSVLILGESGSGKEVVARAIHDSSPRRQRPFVAINCGAIPAELLESELFGHEKGSFTGAISARKGRFELAEGGTLFLDEIGDMSMTMQVKLLRVLQERVFERVGSQAAMRCNVRIIAATHRNLEQAITQGSFREDLFYRLNVFPIETPSLRSRIEDLPLLVRDFARQNAGDGRGAVEFSAPAFGALMHYAWPGNVRELANLIERLSILFPNRSIGVADLPPKYRPPGWKPSTEHCEQLVPAADAEQIRQSAATGNDAPGAESDMGDDELSAQAVQLLMSSSLAHRSTISAELLPQLPQQGLDLKSHLYTIERELIRQALERSSGTVAQAARLLNLRRTTLVEKLRKLDLAIDEAAALVGDSASDV